MKLYIDDDGVERVQLRLVFKRPSPMARAVRFFKRWRKAGYARRPGMHRGMYQVRDDFDDPLPEDFLISQI
jgi:hypothetical protein